MEHSIIVHELEPLQQLVQKVTMMLGGELLWALDQLVQVSVHKLHRNVELVLLVADLSGAVVCERAASYPFRVLAL